MKQELLEYLTRYCVREVLSQINEGSESNTCQRCKGKGYYSGTLRNHGSGEDVYHEAIPCDFPGCHNGKVDREENRHAQGIGPCPHLKEEETPTNANDFHVDAQGAWCKDCGSKGHLAKVGLGDLKYVCSNQKCKNARGMPLPHYRGLKEADDETKGAPAPPADGQGTAEQPEIPKDKDTTPEPPSEPETPPPSPELKGIIMVDPRDKSKLDVQKIQGGNDAALERELYRIASSKAGPSTKVALATSRMVKGALSNPNTAVYLYLGKYDPESREIFLMADKSLQIAKDQSISPAELTGTPTTMPAPTHFDPITASPGQLAQRMQAGGQTQVPRVDEKLVKVIRKMVNEMLDKK